MTFRCDSFSGRELHACLTGGRSILTFVSDTKKHRADTEWRVLRFRHGGKTYSVEYSVREREDGVWMPFGGHLKRHDCREEITR